MMTVGAILADLLRFIRRNLLAIAVWGALYVALNVVMEFALPQSPPGPITAASLPIVLMRFTIAFLWSLVLYTACFRAVMLPGESRFFYLRFGGDELRMIGMTIVTAICLMVLVGLASVALFILIGMLAATMGVIGGLIGVLALIGLWSAMVYLLVRLSPAWPLTVQHGRFMLDEGWQLSKGRFWRMFGAYFAVYIVLVVIGAALIAAMMGPVLPDLFHPTDPAARARLDAWEAAQTGGSIAMRLLWSIVGGAVSGIVLAWHVGVVGCTARALLAERAFTPASSNNGPWG